MIKWINKKRNQKGFTLIELIVVIAILGILAAIAIPRLSGAKVLAQKSAIEANLRTIDSASVIHEAQNDSIAQNLEALVTAELLQPLPDKIGVTYSIDDETGRALVAIDANTLKGTHAAFTAMDLNALLVSEAWIALK